MTSSKIDPTVVFRAAGVGPGRTATVRASLTTRALARLRAGKYDRQVELGEPMALGSPLAVHMARLGSATERRALAESLWAALRAAKSDGRPAAGIPVHRSRVIGTEDLIDEVAVRLVLAAPVKVRGVARLRLLLSDGTGPLYETGRGSLNAALRGVLAAL